MLEHLRNPEYLHVLLNPLPVYGVALGVVGLLIALLTRSGAARVTALAIVFLSAFSAWPVYHYGEAGYDRVLAMADNDGRNWLDEHQRRGERLIALFYLLATLAAAAVAAERFAPRAALPLTLTVAIVATATMSVGAYIAAAGGRIRHREFRYVPAPEPSKAHEE